MCNILRASFFFESGPIQTHNRQPFWVQGIQLAPNGYTLAGFAIGTLHLPITAALHLRALYKTKSCSSERIYISCQPRLKNILQLGNHGDLSCRQRDLGKKKQKR